MVISSDVKIKGIEIGIASAPKIFELMSNDLRGEAPEIIPHVLLAGFTELSYSSRTIRQEVSLVLCELAKLESIDDFRKALSLLWANRTRISAEQIGTQTDLLLSMLARIERSGDLSVPDKAMGLLLLEVVAENDPQLQRGITRRFRRLLRSRPDAMQRLLPN